MMTLTDSEHIQAKEPSQTYLSPKRPSSMTVSLGVGYMLTLAATTLFASGAVCFVLM